MNCDYCKTFHDDHRCPSCGAPVTRSAIVQNRERHTFHALSWSGYDFREVELAVEGVFVQMPPRMKLVEVKL